MTELPAGRELDKQVALALGYTLYMTNVHPNGWGLWDGVSDDVYIDDRPRGYGKTWLPRYSAPRTAGDRAALLECVMWLLERRAHLGSQFSTDSANDRYYVIHLWKPGHEVNRNLVLAICRAVVKAATFLGSST